MPTVDATESAAIVPDARASGSSVRATLISRATAPRPSPCRARPAMRNANGSGSAVRTPRSTTTASEPGTADRRRGPEPSLPSTGAAIAPANSVTVRVHCAAASGTFNVVATEVISGAPRLLITATTSATATRALLSSAAGRSESIAGQTTRHAVGA